MPFFALVDCNNFYASCEKLFRPDLADKPVVVLSNNDGNIISRSAEAKALGIPMADPVHEWADFFRRNGVHVFSSNYVLYGDLSERVHTALRSYCPDIEAYSIDEAFLYWKHLSNPWEIADEIRTGIQRRTGIPVSVGIATSKTLAKCANKFGKKAGRVHVIDDLSNGDLLLQEIEIGDVWGIGPAYAEWLRENRIATACDLKYANDETLRKRMTVQGQRTLLELRGMSCIPLVTHRPAKQAVNVSRSFGKLQTDLHNIREALALYIARACEKLREQRSVAGTVHVYINTNTFRDDLPQYNSGAKRNLALATNYTPEITAIAVELLNQIFRPGFHYKKVGVLLTDLHPENELQLDFSRMQYPFERNRRAMTALDKVNDRFGRNAITFAGMGIARPWTTRRVAVSPRYTTQWEELPIVKA